MQHLKRYCKLIFSTFVVALVFCCYPLVAHADPLTGAMMGSAMASGFSFPGFAGLSVPSSESIIGDFFVDLVPWSDLVQAAHAYVTIRDLVGSNNVEVELSPELSSAGYDRTNQLNSQYNLSPSTFHNFGTFKAFGDYVFDTPLGSDGTTFCGPVLGYTPDPTFVGYSQTFTSDPRAFVTLSTLERYPTQFFSKVTIGNYVGSNSLDTAVKLGSPIVFCTKRESGYDKVFFGCLYQGSYQRLDYLKTPSQTGVQITSASPVVSRDNSAIIDSNNKSNKIVIPSSYVQDIPYTSGSRILDETIVKKALDAVSDAGFQGDVISSDYVDPVDPPVPPTSETIADTPYTTLNEVFYEFKEWFGDIYDGISGFKESFGDWVDDVAAGWTEVFGDIYDTLAGFRESFGDFADTIGTAIGDIADTISDIADGVADIVDDIISGDFNFIDGFWKNFQAPFLPFFNTIKSHLGIWHYVVEWLSSIGSAFTFFFGVLSYTGYNFILPIYAAFAGTVVLAVYRRFGK